MTHRAAPVECAPIPPMTVGPLVEAHEPVLLWVHTGTATVDAGGVAHRLAAGEAIWVPPGIEHCTRTDAGAVVFPFFLRPAELAGALAEVHVVLIPPAWEEWMVHRWDDNSYTRETLTGAETLLHLVAEEPSARDDAADTPQWLAFPRSREAFGAARALLRRPGSPGGIESYASRELVSAKTLQRQFVHETGLPFSEWRTRARVAIAASHLAEGRTITWTAGHVGYVTLTGFAKAFRRHTGLSPREYARRHPRRPESTVSPAADRTTLPVRDEPTRPAPRVPARTFWHVVRPRHELMWVYRGSVTLRIGTRAWALSQGHAIWVPAGIPHSVEHPEGALVLTVGTAHGRAHLSADELTVFDFPPEAEAFLLHTMLSEFTLFRPATGCQDFVRRIFREQFGTARTALPGFTGALGEMADVLHRDPSDRRSLADWATHLRTTPESLGRELLVQTGDTFPRWRARIRMDAARHLLCMGETPGQVAPRLGYASPATFARAFTAAHGIPPREYQRRETRRPQPTSALVAVA